MNENLKYLLCMEIKTKGLMNRRYLKITILFIALLCISGTFFNIAKASEPVKIALIISRTGIAAKDNAPAIKGAKLAVEEINSKGGLLGHCLQLVVINNKSTPLGSKFAAEEAVKLNVAAVIGAMWSSHSMPMINILQQARIPMISPTSTKQKITLAHNYIFRVCITDETQGRILAMFAYMDLKARTVVILKNINEEYSLGLAESFARFFTQKGGKILYQGNYTGKAVDFADVLTKTKKIHPDVLFIPGYARDSGFIVKQAVKMGIKSTFLGGDGWEDTIYNYSGNAIEQAYYLAHWHPDVLFAQNEHFLKLYRKRYGKKNNNVIPPLTYDSIMLFADAVRRTGSQDRVKIRNALAETKDFKGASGTITFDDNGDPLNKKVIILKFENRSSVPVQSMIP